MLFAGFKAIFILMRVSYSLCRDMTSMLKQIAKNTKIPVSVHIDSVDDVDGFVDCLIEHVPTLGGVRFPLSNELPCNTQVTYS